MRGEQGQAVLRFKVDRWGRVLDYAVVSGTGYADLDAAAESMLRGATLPAFPTTMTMPQIEVTVTIRFDLGSTEPGTAVVCAKLQREYEGCFKAAVAGYWKSTRAWGESAKAIKDDYQRRAFERAAGLFQYTPEEVAQSRCGHFKDLMWQLGCPE